MSHWVLLNSGTGTLAKIRCHFAIQRFYWPGDLTWSDPKLKSAHKMCYTILDKFWKFRWAAPIRFPAIVENVWGGQILCPPFPSDIRQGCMHMGPYLSNLRTILDNVDKKQNDPMSFIQSSTWYQNILPYLCTWRISFSITSKWSPCSYQDSS